MLDQHLLNGGFGEVRVDRLTTLLIEIGKGGDKRPVCSPFRVNPFCQSLPKRGHPFPELCHRLLPFCVLLRPVGKEGFEGMYQLRRIGQVGIKGLLIVLPKDGAVWGLEEDVVAGVTSFKLAEYLGG